MTLLEKKFKTRLKRIESMRKHTTFMVGGPAKYFLEVRSSKELVEAARLAKKDGLNYVIIGMGSNLLVNDKGFDGLIVKMKNEKCKMIRSSKLWRFGRVKVEAGMKLKDLSQYALRQNLTGIEWAMGVPGTMGGAIVMNAGCFGNEIKDSVVKVRYFDTTENGSTLKIRGTGIKELTNKQCKFGYRNSVFMKHPKWIVLEIELKLKKGSREKIKKNIKECLSHREQSLPFGPSAGSIFKKYIICKKEKLNKKLERILQKEHPEFLKGKYIPAGWLIEEAGLKGRKIGKAQVSKEHANFIINTGNARAEDIVILIALVKERIRNEFGVQLREEVIYLGF